MSLYQIRMGIGGVSTCDCVQNVPIELNWLCKESIKLTCLWLASTSGSGSVAGFHKWLTNVPRWEDSALMWEHNISRISYYARTLDTRTHTHTHTHGWSLRTIYIHIRTYKREYMNIPVALKGTLKPRHSKLLMFLCSSEICIKVYYTQCIWIE